MAQPKPNTDDMEKKKLEDYKFIEEQYIYSEKLLGKLLKDQESQNKYISQELYHVIAQSLYSILLGLRMTIDSIVDERLKDYLKKLEKSGDELLKKIKKLSFELYPLFIEDIGFVGALKTDIKLLKQDGVNIELNINKEERESADYDRQFLLYQVTHGILSFIINEVKSEHLKVMITFFEGIEDKFLFSFTNGPAALSEKLIEEGLVLTMKRLVGWNGQIRIFKGRNEFEEWVIEARIPR